MTTVKKITARNYMARGPGAWKDLVAPEPPSLPWQTLRYVETLTDQTGKYEVWENDRYYLSVRRYAKGFFLKNSPYIVIGISNDDESAHHDFRDFQAIKNDIAGRDWEGIELYPAESRLKDPSNRFYLYCVPKGLLKFGLPGGRVVCTSAEAIAPQRPFPGENGDGR
jgi:hypothetical protein